MSRFDSGLPFPRGQTYGDGVATLDAAYGAHLLGRIYEVNDTEHGTGQFVKLRVVKAETAITVPATTARIFHAFGTDALDIGRTILAAAAGAGVICKPLDDAYAVAKVIAANDLCYVVEEGPCYCSTETSAVSLAAGDAVASDATGFVNGAVAAAGEYVVGVIDQAASTTATQVVVHIAGGITNSEA